MKVQQIPDSVCVKARIKADLHQKLKDLALKEERSMNYLINKAVELLVTKAA